MTDIPLYLASASPRRRDILQQLGYRVRTVPADIDETPKPNESAYHYVGRMALEKNRAARQLHGSTLDPAVPLLSADTTVALDSRILGKPADTEEAFAMLAQLSGTSHQVMTAVCISRNGREYSVLQSSEVRFKTLSEQEIHAYIASGEPMDKAGAYAIQGIGGTFVCHLSGSFTGVMGLPVFETAALLRECGCAVPPLAP
ncbi:Maf family protein [Conchiformibius kuhniae]|uniref:dTTP/UTP pyrophosphatase n=1 Tax=Conchiformibius kuhniae TaxID=211502 RepID=A0A8T9MVF0_9NEIS|nr:Maf family protein [Conchiformibius kuhniae]UOP04446.1 Maf family nucleotide pyrophosphatase [Conchiformibius kuhniae]